MCSLLLKSVPKPMCDGGIQLVSYLRLRSTRSSTGRASVHRLGPGVTAFTLGSLVMGHLCWHCAGSLADARGHGKAVTWFQLRFQWHFLTPPGGPSRLRTAGSCTASPVPLPAPHRPGQTPVLHVGPVCFMFSLHHAARPASLIRRERASWNTQALRF